MFFSVLPLAALATLASGVAADFIEEGNAANFRYFGNQTICFGLGRGAYNGASLVATSCTEESAVFYPVYGSGKETQIVYGDWCITSAGASPSSDVTVVDCDNDDSAQLWTVTDYKTVETADGKCITLGRAGLGAPTTLAECSLQLASKQLWNPTTVA